MVRSIHTYSVTPALPGQLARLQDLAYNLWWSWDAEATELFRRLDRELWEKVAHNPVRLLGAIDQGRLSASAKDAGFLTHLGQVMSRWDEYMAGGRTWYAEVAGEDNPGLLAYFCMEFGLSE